jgi:Uma2 family endonuclease
MQAVQVEPLTVEDYRSLPEGGPRYQLIEGDLIMAPAPNRYHQDISLNLVLLFGGYLAKHPIGCDWKCRSENRGLRNIWVPQ